MPPRIQPFDYRLTHDLGAGCNSEAAILLSKSCKAMHAAHSANQHGPGPGRLALSATLHCLTGCGIGEVLGLVIANALGWPDLPAILLAVALAFLFGYSLTLRPLLAGGLGLAQAARLAFAADTLSI